MTAAAFKAAPPLTLDHGYANEEGEARGMAPPRSGCFEIVNKNKEGEIIAILVAANASELVLKGRDVHGYLPSHLRLMPDCVTPQPLELSSDHSCATRVARARARTPL